MKTKLTKAAAISVLAVGLVASAAAAQDATGPAQGGMPMMNDDHMRNMQGGDSQGMGGMMGMMSAMTEMMQTCNKMMQAALPDQKRPADAEKDG
jgi:hypothetical protein